MAVDRRADEKPCRVARESRRESIPTSKSPATATVKTINRRTSAAAAVPVVLSPSFESDKAAAGQSPVEIRRAERERQRQEMRAMMAQHRQKQQQEVSSLIERVWQEFAQV